MKTVRTNRSAHVFTVYEYYNDSILFLHKIFYGFNFQRRTSLYRAVAVFECLYSVGFYIYSDIIMLIIFANTG